MTKSGQDDSRRSRWVWEIDDVVIIKKGDEQGQIASEHTENEPSAADDKASKDTSDQSDQSKGQ